MAKLFGSRTGVPDRDPTDEVIQVNDFDDTMLFRAFAMHSMFVIEDVLDPEKLRAQGRLEFHIPQAFSQERPAITFTHVAHNIAAEAHPHASHLPKPSKTPVVMGDPGEFEALYLDTESPTKLDDYLTIDRPVVGLYVSSFLDKTVVTLHWPHILFDALGSQGVVKNWTLILQGREAEVIPLHGVEKDPLAELGKHPREVHKLTDRRMGMPTLVGYVLKNIVDLGFRGKENRIACIPAAFIQKLRSDALQELTSDTSLEDGKGLFLSEGDVLVAWWSQLVVSHLSKPKNTTIAIQNAFSQRSVLTEELPPGSLYVSNCMGFINTLLPSQELLEQPLSRIALEVRRSIDQQRTREQVEAYCALQRKSKDRILPLFGDSSMHIVGFTNWTKAKLFDVDFSAARVNQQESGPLPPSYIQSMQYPYNFNEGFIFQRDGGGNYWLTGYRVKGAWAAIERQLAKYSLD
ncbi:hypothetical protein SCAR479_00201 [Seiridium cardinale]|uniref:Uncharacterized protein n=1 Tax=Seiridium cardinale TaxID=138064 RepID=A0ABR2Y8U8_9PEZI